ncbi:MAG: ATP-binding protein [Deltaproteobacteria bacterium]|nr:MAG: ATP-binding protein [Deltaproteobacteria bacterium]
MGEIDPVSLLEPAATRVRDPVSGKSVWLAQMVRRPRVEDGTLKFDLVFGTDHTKQDRTDIQAMVVQNLKALGVDDVQPFARLETPRPGPSGKPAGPPVRGMDQGAMAPHGGPIHKRSIPGVKHIVAVASGKGGVGKSTVATNLAVGLKQFGLNVGLMDADVYGPSLPTMMNVHSKPVVNKEKRIQPVQAHGVSCLSIGLVVDPEEAIIWRGPMIMGLLRQFIQDTDWGELDYLIVDLPPGTGDAQLSLIQAVPLAGAVIVTTPQDIALADAVRGITMFRKLDVPLLGLVENMAYYPLPDGTRDYVFGQDGGKNAAEKYGTELLAEVPLQTAVRRAGDDGTPAVLGTDPVAHTFSHIAKRITEKLPV